MELVKLNPKNVLLRRLLISFYINQKENEKAKKIGGELIKRVGRGDRL